MALSYLYEMIVRKGYKFRLNSSPAVEALLRPFAGCNRFLWNKALAFQKERRDNKQRRLTYCKMCNLLTAWKKEYPFLSDTPSQSLQQTLKSLSKALTEAFDPANPKKFPVFKRKFKSRESFRYPQGFEISNSQIFLPKVGRVGFRKSRPVKGKPKNVMVFKEIDHWYISIQTEIEIVEPAHPSTKATGIDLGIRNIIALSDGTYIPPINAFRSKQKKLAKLQRQLSRKVKLSNNWCKLNRKIQKLHWHIANIRKDYLHKTSCALSKNHAIVCMENLSAGNMSRSARGTIESPGQQRQRKVWSQ